MVDLSTAMAAAAASERRRGGRDGDKKRPGGKVGTEPFDPAEHVEKEKADAASMWLVLVYALGIGLLMRYGLMPQMDGPASILWSLPLLLIFTIPTLHRLILSKFADRYTFGNWFRATFLYTFTWLAVCFILVNPPLADISPPEVASKVKLVDLNLESEEVWNEAWSGEFSEDDNLSERDLALAFAVRDNFDAENVNVLVEISWQGSSNWNRTGTASSMMGDWDDYAANVSSIATKPTDVAIFIPLENISFAPSTTYTVEITLSQSGDPWELDSSETYRFSII